MAQKKFSHEFALFVPGLSLQGAQISLQDQDVVHRLTHVLRLAPGDSITLFNDTQALQVTVTSMTKKAVACTLEQVVKTHTLVPRITVLLPILKKEALEEAIYSCVELGVTELVLVKTEKTHTAAFMQVHRDRLQKIIHAAQEQAKQFAPITLSGPYALSEALNDHQGVPEKIVALQGGGRLIDCLKKDSKHILVTVGPEADFTDQEKTLLHEQGFKACSLGPTVLRAQQAVTVFVGSLRTLTV